MIIALDSTWLHSRFAEAFGWMLVHSLWELSVIAAVAGMLHWHLKRSADGRYIASCAALLLMVFVPVGTYFVMLPNAGAPSVAAVGAGDLFSGISSPAAVSMTPAGPAPATSWSDLVVAAIRSRLPQAVLLYGAGAALFALRLAGGFWRLRVISAGATPIVGQPQKVLVAMSARLAISRPVRLLESALVEVPTVLGILRPVILLPASALTGLSQDQLSAILAHELAHIRRHDFLANTAQSIIEALLFYHPAVWWLSAKIRQQREHCCDDAAVATAGNPLAYAQALAAMEHLRASPSGVPSGLAVAARSGALLPRISRVLGVQPRPQRSGLLSGSVVLVVTLTLAASLYIVGCAQAGSPPAQQATDAQPTSPAGEVPQILIKMTIMQVDDAALTAAMPGAAIGKADAKESAKVLPVDAAELLKSVTANKNSVVVSRPSLLVNDRMTASIMMGNSQPYISGYKLKDPSDPKSENVPVMGSFDTGVKMNVVPTLKDGGKSVSINIDAEIADLLEIKMIDAPQSLPNQKLKIMSPILDKRNMKTTLIMGSDQTAVILGPIVASSDAKQPAQRLLLFVTAKQSAGKLEPAAPPSATQPVH